MGHGLLKAGLVMLFAVTSYNIFAQALEPIEFRSELDSKKLGVIRALFYDGSGLWVGGENGLFLKRGDTAIEVKSDRESFGYVADIDALDSEHLLVSVFGEGLKVINKYSKRESLLVQDADIDLNSIWQVDVSNSIIAVSTVDNIILMEKNGLRVLSDFREEGITDGQKVHSLAFGSDGESLWWVEKNRGLYRLEISSRRWTHIPLDNLDVEDLEITSLLQDEAGIYVGTTTGVYLVSDSGEVVTKYVRSADNGQRNKAPFMSLARDMTGKIWAAAEELYIISDDSITLSRPRHLFPYLSTGAVQIVSNIVFDNNNNIIIADTQRGLGVIPSQSIATSYMETEGGIFHNHINSMSSEKSGQLFLTSNSEVYFFDFQNQSSMRFELKTTTDLKILSVDGATAKVIDEDANLFRVDTSSNNVVEIGNYQEVEGRVIDAKEIASRGDFLITEGFSGEKIHLLSEEKHLSKAFPGASIISQIDGDRVFIGVDGDGIYEWTRTNNIEKVLIPHDFELQNIICIYQTKRGYLLICTSGGGLLEYNTKENRLEDLSFYDDLHIRGVTEISQEYLIVMSNKGLSLLDLEREEVIELGESFGVVDSDFEYQGIVNTAEHVVIVGDNLNYLLKKDALLKEIDKLRSQRTAAIITDFRAYNDKTKMIDSISERLYKAQLSSTELELDNSEFLFEADVSNISLVEDSNFILQYRLLGISSEWIDVEGKHSTLTFSSLGMGTYTLQARVTSDVLDTQAKTETLKIKVPPPVWLQWPALMIYCMLIVSIVGSQFTKLKFKLLKFSNLIPVGMKDRESELTESALQMKEHVEKKQKMFSDIAHEIKSPVMLIREPLKEIRDNPKDDKANKRRIEIALNQAQSLQCLVNQIIQIERLESVTKLPRKPIQVKECIEGLCIQMQALTDFKSQVLDVKVNGDAVLILIEDSLEKIITNLVANASKYSDAKTTIRVRVKVEEDNVIIRVVDEGVGISESDFELIFQRFGQLKKVSEEGTGIGLAMVKELVRVNGGGVELKSKEGEGSTFTVTLPVTCSEIEAPSGMEWVPIGDNRRDNAVEEQLDNEELDNEKPLILIVDDSRDMRFYLCNLFEPHYNCVTARNGQHAIDVLQVYKPDVIISDLEMPQLNGIELAKYLKESETLSLIPFVMLTAHEDKELKSSAWEQEIDDFIPKPFDGDELIIKIRNILSNRSKISEHIELNQPSLGEKETVDIPQFTSRKDMEFYTNFLAVVEKNYSDEKWGRADAAGLLLISERQLNRKVSDLFDCSFTEFLRNHRLTKAGVRLANGEQITHVAYGVGFSTPSYFSSCFKQKFGKSPKCYQDEAIVKSSMLN